MARISLLTNHSLVVRCIAEDPHTRIRDIAEAVDITERATQRIVAELVENGFVERFRDGRRNRYTLHTEVPIARGVSLGSLLEILVPAGDGAHEHA